MGFLDNITQLEMGDRPKSWSDALIAVIKKEVGYSTLYRILTNKSSMCGSKDFNLHCS